MTIEESYKEKRERLTELTFRYIDMGEEIYKMEKELGRIWTEHETWEKNFKAILKPAEFFLENVAKLVRPHREVYNITAMKILPSDKRYGL